MNKHKQRIAIAEFREWTDIRPVLDDDPETFGIDLVGKRNGGRDYVPLPDWLNDLNAMHEAEGALSPDDAARFNDALKNIFAARPWRYSDSSANYGWHASAKDRAEAFLRTIGKWEDGE